MTYRIYLCEEGERRLIAEADANLFDILNPGEEIPVKADGEEVRFIIQALGEPEIGLDGRTLLWQDVFVRYPQSGGVSC